MRICVHGAGTTALVTAASLAASGHFVTLNVRNAQLAQDVRNGSLPIDEPGLAELMAQQMQEQRLTVLDGVVAPEGRVAVHFIAFNTDDPGQCDPLLREIAAFPGDLLLVNNGGFGVGATEYFGSVLREHRPAGTSQFTSSACFPDFLRGGTALENFNRPDRIILGCRDPWAQDLLREILRPFASRESRVLVMPARDAEFTRLVISGMLATRLSYMNDMANVASAIDVDIDNVRVGVGSDRRIGNHFLYAGCGFGGTSFYRDLMALRRTLENSGVASRLIETALQVNEEQKDLLFRRLWVHFRGELAGKVVAIWGVAFKPDTDRVDNAPSLRIIESLLAQGAEVRVHDPKAVPQLLAMLGDVPGLRAAGAYEALEGADALLVLTEWREYWSPDFQRMRALMRTPLLLDGRNIYDPPHVRAQGLTYIGVGRR